MPDLTSMSMFAAARQMRVWTRLAMMWGLYYLLIFTLGINPRFMQQTIWIGAAVVVLSTVPVVLRHVRFRDVPREDKWLWLFFGWSLTGVFSATDMAEFGRFAQLVFEFAMVVTLVSLVLKYSGASRWLFGAYLGVALFRVLTGDIPIGLEQLEQTGNVVARIHDANSVGYYSLLGILGVLALLWETKRWGVRLLLAGSGLVALYGVVLSTSRGAFIALIAIAVLWPTLCLVGSSRYKLGAIAIAVLLLGVAYLGYEFILQETNMGTRFMRSTHMEDNSTQVRFGLVMTAFRIFSENPVFGCGLGQFGAVSGTGYYAHNEVAEVLATTGLPGFILLYSVYAFAWVRLTRSLRWIQEPLFRYRINIARIGLLMLMLSGSLSRPNFLAQDTMFLLGIVVGTAHWAERLARLGVPAPRTAFACPAFDPWRLPGRHAALGPPGAGRISEVCP